MRSDFSCKWQVTSSEGVNSVRREVSGLSTITCIPSPCGGGLGWGAPYSNRARREGEGQARSGGGRSTRVRPGTRTSLGRTFGAKRRAREPRMGITHAGRRVRGAFSFGSFLWARKVKEPVVRGWVSRQKASVRWTLGPANGLATDGEHRTCKREHGERSAASPFVNNRR